MHTYLDQLRYILDHGVQKNDRTGVGTISCFGLQARYAMADGFPAVTTKRLVWKSMLSELLWFVSGSDNIHDLTTYLKSNRLWDGNYEDYCSNGRRVYKEDGEMGRIYGMQWREYQTCYGKKEDSSEVDERQKEIDFGEKWRCLWDDQKKKVNGKKKEINSGEQWEYQWDDQKKKVTRHPWRRWQDRFGKKVDQLQEAIDLIRENPESRRILVNAWNAAEISPQKVALPPCHVLFQFYVAEGNLSLQMYQRSGDMFLGVPLNIASYSTLLHMVAKITGLVPHEFIHVLGDAHIYLDHLDAVKAQLSRTPYPLPQLRIADRGQTEIDDFEMDDFELVNYQHHPTIRAKMAV